MIDVINHVPIGEAHALSSREIWQIIDCWSEITISKRLNDLAVAGKINRKAEHMPRGAAFKYLYWREAA